MDGQSETFSFDLGGKITEIKFASGPHAFENASRALHIFDANTAGIFPSIPENSVVLSSGETAKTWESVGMIIRAAFSGGMARDSLFIGVGGGVVCDVAAFAASVFMRGARLRLVPTTLLSMVDAAFGGKTAVNFEGYKNMVGTFFPAEGIELNPGFLSSLPRREFFSGLAEIIKAGMLRDETLFSLLEDRRKDVNDQAQAADPVFLREIIERSILVKAKIVEEDPTERGIRAHLNLGHTFAHGLESATGFKRYTHGEAVAWGILRALDAGSALGLTDQAYRERASALFRSFGYAESVADVQEHAILEAITRDKKKKEGRVRFVLQKKLGDTFLSHLDDLLVRDVVRRGLA